MAMQIGDFLDALGFENLVLLATFIISFVVINLSLKTFLKKRFKESTRPVAGIISFALSMLIIYGVHRTNFDLTDLFYNIGISVEMLELLIPLVIVAGIALLFWKIKFHIFWILGLFLIIVGFTDWVYEQEIVIITGVILCVLFLILRKIFKKKPAINNQQDNSSSIRKILNLKVYHYVNKRKKAFAYHRTFRPTIYANSQNEMLSKLQRKYPQYRVNLIIKRKGQRGYNQSHEEALREERARQKSQVRQEDMTRRVEIQKAQEKERKEKEERKRIQDLQERQMKILENQQQQQAREREQQQAREREERRQRILEEDNAEIARREQERANERAREIQAAGKPRVSAIKISSSQAIPGDTLIARTTWKGGTPNYQLLWFIEYNGRQYEIGRFRNIKNKSSKQPIKVPQGNPGERLTIGILVEDSQGRLGENRQYVEFIEDPKIKAQKQDAYNKQANLLNKLAKLSDKAQAELQQINNEAKRRLEEQESQYNKAVQEGNNRKIKRTLKQFKGSKRNYEQRIAQAQTNARNAMLAWQDGKIELENLRRALK